MKTKAVLHEEQKRIWEQEHKTPYVLKQMDSDEASSGVMKFWEFLKIQIPNHAKGIEMGCGKGRNVIWLAKQGVEEMCGFDFSPRAIAEAKKRAVSARVSGRTFFTVQDATEAWPQISEYFDFGIDCFASTDIEFSQGRKFAIREMHRVLKAGGYLMAYLLSPDDKFHRDMIQRSPAQERNAFLHPATGKFEKTFDRNEILKLYKDFTIIREERVAKTAEFFGRQYACKHFWMIFQKK